MKHKTITKTLFIGSLLSSFTGLAVCSTLAIEVGESYVIQKKSSKAPASEITFEQGLVPEDIKFGKEKYIVIKSEEDFKKYYPNFSPIPDFSKSHIVVFHTAPAKQIGEEIKIKEVKYIKSIKEMLIIYELQPMKVEGGIQVEPDKKMTGAVMINFPVEEIKKYIIALDKSEDAAANKEAETLIRTQGVFSKPNTQNLD